MNKTCLTTSLFDGGYRVLPSPIHHIHDHHGRSLGSKQQSRLVADAAPAASDQSYLVFESHKSCLGSGLGAGHEVIEEPLLDRVFRRGEFGMPLDGNKFGMRGMFQSLDGAIRSARHDHQLRT